MRLTLRLAAWTPPIAEAATFAAPWVHGYFSEANLDFTWQTADGSAAALGLVESGAADVAFASCFGVLQAIGRGAPILAVYNLFPRSCFVVFGPGGSQIARPAELAGRRIGTRSIHSSGTAWLQALLRLDGRSGDDVRSVVVGDDGVRMLLTGEVDGLVGSDAILYDALRAGLESPFTFWLDTLLPLPSDVLAIRPDRIEEVGPAVRRFLRAYRRGVHAAAQRPAWAAEALARGTVDGVDERRNRAMLALRLLLSSPRTCQPLGWFDVPAICQTAARLGRLGVLSAHDALVAGAFTNEVVAGLDVPDTGASE
ncbi:MAG: ABC transporter substrate-binding protein [Chloroflexi bacterium]|nr:ABC transporter substrate-binding protein [Chloroflexota bacterium]